MCVKMTEKVRPECEDVSVEEDQESCGDVVDDDSDWYIGELTDEDSEDDGGERTCPNPEKFGPDPTYEDLYDGSYGPSDSVMAVGDDPLALLFYFMPPKPWAQIAFESNRYHTQSIPQRVRTFCSHQRRAGQEVGELGDIRSRLAGVPDSEPWEVLRVVGLLIARMLMPMRKGIAAYLVYEATKSNLQTPVPKDNNTGEAAVLRNINALCPPSTTSPWRLVITDRFYTSVKLTLELLHRRMYLTGTIQTDRAGYAKGVLTKKEIKQVNKQKIVIPPQGTIKLAANKRFPQLTATMWMDHTPVYLLSSGVRRVHRKIQPVPVPELVRDYHRWMGGVDVHDQLRMQRYSVQLSYKTRKYYKSLFLGLFAMALVNAFIVFRHHKKLNDNRPPGKTRPPKHYAFFETLLEQLLAVDSAETYQTIEVRYQSYIIVQESNVVSAISTCHINQRATTARERAAASPSRETDSYAPAVESTVDMGGHRLEENPDTVDNEQGLKKRQRSCKIDEVGGCLDPGEGFYLPSSVVTKPTGVGDAWATPSFNATSSFPLSISIGYQPNFARVTRLKKLNTMSRSNWKDCWNFDSRKPDFTAWQIRIRALLRGRCVGDCEQAEGVWEIVNKTRQFNNYWHRQRRQEFISHDKKAFQLLINSLDDATVKVMGKYEYSWLVYEHMERVYASKDTVSIYHARASFHNLKYKDGDDMQSYINDLDEKAETLARLGRPIDDEEKVMHMLGSLPDSWKNLVMVCQNQKVLKWRDLQTKLLLEIDTRKHSSITTDLQAHLANGKVLRRKHCSCCTNNCDEAAHFGQGSNRNLSKKSSRPHPYQRNDKGDKSKLCNYCGKPGHFIKACQLKVRHDRERGITFQPAVSANATHEPDTDDDETLDSYDVLAVAVSMKYVQSCPGAALQATSPDDPTVAPDAWVLDSGCTHHMCFDKSYFTDMKPIEKRVYLGDNNYVDVKGIGAAVLNLTDTNNKIVKLTLSKCFYLPEMKRNLLSVRCLREKGVYSDFSTFVDRAVINKGRMKVKSMHNTFNKLYVFKANKTNTTTESAYIASGSQSMQLWHSRCGHLGYQNIAKLVSRGRAHGLHVPKRDLAEFPVCDVCERSNLQRASKKCYVLVFVDDYSGFVTTFLLAHKSEALARFKEYVVAAETKHNVPAQTVNSDNGGEFISPDWIAYNTSKGIHVRSTTPYTPEQNGSAEVRFRVLFRKVRALLIGAQLPKQFWGEALLTATLLNNISPLRRAEVTPYELWHRKEPDYSNLRVFGSLAYTYVTPTHSKRLKLTSTPGKRKTLDNRAVRGIFVGYADGQKAWRVLHCGTNSIVTTCHATFDESGSIAAMELKQLELGRLQKLHHLDFIQPSRLANSICDLVFYAEPVPVEATDNGAEIQHLDAFIDEFNIDELRDENGNLPDVSCYTGRISSQPVRQGQVGCKPQALTMCATEQLSMKQKEAELLVATENIADKNENSKISGMATRIEPKTHDEAVTGPDAPHWRKAIDKEGRSLIAHGTWKLVPLPKGKRALTSKWVFKIKYDAQGNVERYKARLVIRGYEQVKYVDYDEIFAPVIRLESLRMLLALVAINDWECHQTDVDTAFLNSDMAEEIRRNRAAKTLTIDQTTYAKSGFERFNLLQLNPCKTPCDPGVVLSKEDCPKTDEEHDQVKSNNYRGLVGSLMYLMTGSRPDLAFGIQCVSKFFNNPGITRH
ncbi:unnamed protein product [Phytophthora fragariaefolia]|uniref:Unnamed protein product n=1 Tax=Phytophthora fragariaefolia TaxID=1490495 RepID=A0A9W6TVM7_9STRA|nr:unnamed protein product [Phytophthora fragariaefolia]